MSDLSGFVPSRFLAAVADRSSLFLSTLHPIRHFPLACLLAVLFFFPGASFAVGQVYSDVVVQGAMAYISPAAAQARIDALIAADMAAHPGAARNGNSVQWEESGDGANKRITRSYSVRQGANVTLYRASAVLIYGSAGFAKPQMETLYDSAGRLVFQNYHNNWNDAIWGYSATSAADAMLKLHEIPMQVVVRNATGPTGYYGQYSVYVNPVAAKR